MSVIEQKSFGIKFILFSLKFYSGCSNYRHNIQMIVLAPSQQNKVLLQLHSWTILLSILQKGESIMSIKRLRFLKWILTNESIFKNSEEIRIEMTFPGSNKKKKNEISFWFLTQFSLFILKEDVTLIKNWYTLTHIT